MARLILEIQSRGRGQPQYRRVRSFPYRIGRAYDNDLILADPTVSAHHLQILEDEQGEHQIENLSSENGTRLLDRSALDRQATDRKLGSGAVALNVPAQIECGHTQIRVLRPDTPVLPARRHERDSVWWHNMTRLPVAFTLLAVLLAVNFFLALGESVDPQAWRQILFMQLVGVSVTVLFATATGFVSRMLTHRWRFGLQLTIACCAMLALMGADELSQLVSYYSSSHRVAEISNYLLMATLFTAIFAWQLRAISHLNRERATGIAIAIAWPLLLLFALQDVIRAPDFSPQPALHTDLRVPDLRQQTTLDIERFTHDVRQQLETASSEAAAADDTLDQAKPVPDPAAESAPAS